MSCDLVASDFRTVHVLCFVNDIANIVFCLRPNDIGNLCTVSARQNPSTVDTSFITWSSATRPSTRMSESQETTFVPLGSRSRRSYIRSRWRHRSRRRDYDNVELSGACPSMSRNSSVVGATPHRKSRRGAHFRSGGGGSVSRGQTGEPKNALMQLNELRPKDTTAGSVIKFRQILRSGPDHSPTYTASMEFNGQVR